MSQDPNKSASNPEALDPVAGSQDLLYLPLDLAKRIIEGDNPLEILDARNLDLLAVTFDAKPGDYSAIRGLIGEHKLSNLTIFDGYISRRLADARKARKEEKRAANLRVVAESDEYEATVGDYIPDAPHGELILPPGYILSRRATIEKRWLHIGDNVIPKEETLAHAPCYITAQTLDADKLKQGVRLTWREKGKYVHRIVDLNTIKNAQRLTNETGDFGFPSCTATQTELSKYLTAFHKINEESMVSITTSGHCGMQGKSGSLGYLIGRNFISPEGEEKGNIDLDTINKTYDGVVFRGVDVAGEAISNAYRKEGSLEKWLSIFSEKDNLLLHYPIPLFGFYTSFVSPILPILGPTVPNFILDFGGLSGTGKTTTQQIIASVWGFPCEDTENDSAMLGWNNTKTAVERHCAIRSGLPLILNDTQTIDSTFLRENALRSFLYVFSEGRSKGRGAAGSGALQESSTWRSVLISSGETKLVNLAGAQGGVLNRVLSLPGAPFGSKSNEKDLWVKDIKRRVVANYGHAGPMFVSWLFRNKDRWDAFRAYHRKIEESLAKKIPGGAAGRLAASAAAVWVAGRLAHEALDLPWSFDDYNPVKMLWPSIANEIDDLDGTERSIQMLTAWLLGHEESFKLPAASGDHIRVPSSGWVGPHWNAYGDGKYVMIRADMIDGEHSILAALGLAPASQYLSQWFDAGYLAPPSSGRGLKHYVRIDGERWPVYCFNRSLLFPSQG